MSSLMLLLRLLQRGRCHAMLAMCSLLASIAMAQPLPGTGSMTGTVHDLTGAVITDARIEVRNDARGIRRETVTDVHGDFSVRALQPDNGYSIAVEKGGFAPLERKA